MKKPLLGIVLALSLVCLNLTGCGGDTKDKDAAKDASSQNKSGGTGRITIAVIPKGTTHEFWKSVHAGAVKAERELNAAGANVQIVWKGPLSEGDREDQIKIVETFVADKVDGICLAPLDDTALRGPVKDANRRNIPVVVFDSGLKGEAGKDFISFVATDNKEGGRNGARKLAKLLDGKGKVVLLRYTEGSASTTNREEGFLEEIAKFPDIEVISSNQYTGPEVSGAQQKAEVILQQYKTADGISFDGIFTPCEPVTFAMVKALDDAKLTDKVAHIGFDAGEKLTQAIEQKKVQGLVLQDPVNMGYLAVKAIYQHLQGEKVDTRIDTGSSVATPENLKDATIHDLLYPPLDKYLN